ncbi:MAG: hypothetical protein ACAI25_15015 [Planctomycetota bacterium]
MGFLDWLPLPKMDWNTVAGIVVGTGVFIGLTVLTGGLGAPLLVTLAVAGFGSGVAGQLTYDLLAGRKPGVDVLAAGVVSMGLTFVGAGVGQVVGRVAAPIVSRILERTGVSAALARAGQAEGAAAATIGKVIDGVKQANPKFGQPQLLDPVFFDAPVPVVVPAARPSAVTKGFIGRF